jgi:predicted Zn-dependent protease
LAIRSSCSWQVFIKQKTANEPMSKDEVIIMLQRRSSNNQRRGPRISLGRILIALLIAGISIITYMASSEFNPITEETQQVALSKEEEVALGLQAAPEMAQMHGGLHPNVNVQTYVDNICTNLIRSSAISETEWPFECHVLADNETVNAFALPGGQIFITAALFNDLESKGQVAGVMAHEMGHVVARHAAEQMAEQQLAQGLSGAAVIAAYDPENPNSGLTTQQFAALISSLVTLKYGRDDELQSDQLGVRFMADAGYDPRAMVRVMEILSQVGGPGVAPEFFSTHPNPDNRITRILEAIQTLYPNGVPDGLKS